MWHSFCLLIVLGLLHGPKSSSAQRDKEKSESEKASERKVLLKAIASMISEAKEQKKGSSTFLTI